jgi:hypothetical protein
MLTPAQAAGVKIAGSSSAPLPAPLREELERGFGAELSAVRIHRDAAAHAAARAHLANAFASGSDIYFSEGAFDAESPRGRRLIAHEVAHVLQQTGRASSEGRLRATPHLSTGLVQCDAADSPDFETLRTLHAPMKKEARDNSKFAAVANELANRVSAVDPGAALEDYFKNSLAQIKDWPVEAESLFYDTLKRYQKFELAAQLIERDDFKGGQRIRTVAWTGALVSALERRNNGQAVYVLAAEKHPVLAFYSEEIVRLVEVFIFQPLEAQIPELLRYGVKEGDSNPQTIKDHAIELSKRLDDNTNLSSTEWVYRALYKIDRLNDLRKAQCVGIHNAAVEIMQKTGEPLIFRKRRYAEGVRDWGEKFLNSTAEIFKDTDGKSDEKDKAAWEPFLKKLGARIAKVGRDALDIWDRKQAIDESMRAYYQKLSQHDDKGVSEAVKGLTLVREAGEKSGLRQQLAEVLAEINRPGTNKESPPPTDEYRQRARDLATKLTVFSREQLEKQQPKLFRDKKTNDEVAHIWLMIWLRETISNLWWMAGGPEASPNVALIDERISQRLRLARRLRFLARPLAWTDVVEAAEVILKAKTEATSQLAILPFADGKFWHQTNAPIEDLGKVFTSRIKGYEPLTGTHLALLFRTAYYEALANKIRELIPVDDKAERQLVDAGVVVPFLAGRANQEIQKLPRPERWSVKDYDYAEKEATKETFAAVIQRHHSYSEITAHEREAALVVLLPEGSGGGVFIWFIPDIYTVVPTLHKIDILNAKVAAALPGKETPAQKLDRAKNLDHYAWFNTLTKSLAKQLDNESMSKDELHALQAALRQALEEKQSQAWEELRRQIRAGSRLDRQLSAKRAMSHLKSYEDDHHRYDEPMKALEPIVRFFVAVSMLEDQDIDAEMTALMLEIAPNLAAAFEIESRFDVVHSYLGWMESAVTFLPTLRAMTPQARHVFLPDYQNTDAWINPRATALEEVTEHFRSVRESIQKGSGYRTSVSEQTLISFMRFSSPIPVGTLLVPRAGVSIIGEPKDQRYRVKKILKDFTYHPPYGFPEGQGQDKKKKKTAVTGYAKAQLLELDDKTPLALKPGEKLLEVAILNRKNQLVATRQVGPEDSELLADIHNGLSWAAFGSAMGNIQAGIEWYVNTLFDLAEFIPGVGQGVTAARIVATIAEFWAEEDYQQIKSFISGEIRDILEGLLQRIKDAADPENLIQLLLFGDQRLDELLAHSNLGKGVDPAKGAGAAQDDASAGKGKFAKIKKVIVAFRRMGRALFKGMRKLHDRVEVPMQDFHAYAASRPLLSFAIQFAADHIFELAALAKQGAAILGMGDEKDRPKGVVDELKGTLKEQQKNFGARLHEILKQLEELKLPETILDMGPVIASILGVLESFVVKRLGLKARVTFFVLQKTGALDVVNERVANEIVQAGVDPNIYWRAQIVPAIADKFTSARDSVVEQTNNLLKQPAFSGVFDKVPKAASLTLKPEGGPFEETSENYAEEETSPTDAEATPFPSPDRPLRVRPARIPAFGPGQGLDPMLRRHVETAFGHDFGHVRLHTGAESDAMTGVFGADGLTTGSHIFLRPTLSPDSGRGQQILHHELAHVLQQTGARPLGEPAGAQPVAGRPGLGLDYDPLREQVADRVATMVSTGRRAREAEGGEGMEAGLQPAGVSLFTIAKMLHSITDLPEIKKREAALSKLTGKAKLPARAQLAVEKTLAVLEDLQGNTALVKGQDKVFKDAFPHIHRRLKNANYAEPIRLAAFEIAREALFDLPAPKPATGTQPTSAPKADQVMKPSHFTRQLEGYILAKTGIVLGLTLNHTKVTAPSGQEMETVDDQNPVKEIKILHIYLPYIDGRSPLWIDAVNNTWPGADDKQRAKIRLQLRPHFEKKGIVSGIWALFGNKYQFSYLFKREVDELVKAAITGGALDPKELPQWSDYVKPQKEASGTNIGLRLATYEDPSQEGAGRASHHLTQYLLADYFANSNKAQPFRKGRDYPGVTWEGDLIKLIAKKPGETAVDGAIHVAKTKGDNGRGNKMPAISLATPTHQSGRLHITAEPDDIGGTTKKSQANAVHNEFSRHMPAALMAADNSVYQQYIKQYGDDAVAKTIYVAAQRTYKEVEKRMSESLQVRMPQLELEYYKELAAGTPNDLQDRFNPDGKTKDETDFMSKLDKVPREAKKHNEKIMREEFGWKLNV